MRELLRESLAGLLLSIGRGLAATIILVALFRRTPPGEPAPPLPAVAKTPLRTRADEELLQLRALDVERLARRAVGWPEE